MLNVENRDIFVINIKELMILGNIKISTSFSNIEDLKFLDDENVFKVNIDLDCRYVPNNFMFVVGKAEFFSKRTCGRCLEDFEHILKIDINNDYEFSDTDNFINIKKEFREDYWLDILPVYICDKDCKGLCSVCGVNLNNTECSCDRNQKNYFLKDIFNKINKKL